MSLVGAWWLYHLTVLADGNLRRTDGRRVNLKPTEPQPVVKLVGISYHFITPSSGGFTFLNLSFYDEEFFLCEPQHTNINVDIDANNLCSDCQTIPQTGVSYSG